MLLGLLNFDTMLVAKLFYVYCKKNSIFLYLQFLLLFSEIGLSPECSLPISHSRASAYKIVAYEKY